MVDNQLCKDFPLAVRGGQSLHVITFTKLELVKRVSQSFTANLTSLTVFEIMRLTKFQKPCNSKSKLLR